MADKNLRQEIIDVIDELGAAVDTDIEQVSEIDEHVSLPGIRTDQNGNFVSYVIAKMSVFNAYATAQTNAIISTWNAWFGSNDETGVRGIFASLMRDLQQATGAANSAAQNANEKAQQVTSAILDIQAEKSAATSAAQNANEKAGLANTIYQTVKTWYESVGPAWSTWFTATQSDWTTWFNARKSEWTQWYNGIKSAYETWLTAAQQAETARQTAETTRQNQESTRESQESTRQNQESTRQNQESTRQSQELTRQRQESTRERQESTRQNQESTRQDQELTRESQENTRQNNEGSRLSSERSRVSAENGRVEAEEERAEEFSRLKSESQGATSAANNAALSANTQAGRAAQAAENANAEAQNLSGLKTDCLNATGAAQSAAQNAGEKMTEIDALVKTISGESSAAPVKMTVSVLSSISTKNKEHQRVSVQLYPTYVMQNVLYQKVSGTSVMIDPSGGIMVIGTGESVFWIIPPQNTELWQQVSVNVRGPRLRLSRSGKIRLNGGRIRIV